MITPATLDPAQWSALQRGEEVEISERMEPQPYPDSMNLGWWILDIHLDRCGVRYRWDSTEDPIEKFLGTAICLTQIAPHAIGDKIAVVCPECGGLDGGDVYVDWDDGHSEFITCSGCDSKPLPDLTVHSITVRQVDGAWYWALGVKLEDA